MCAMLEANKGRGRAAKRLQGGAVEREETSRGTPAALLL